MNKIGDQYTCIEYDEYFTMFLTLVFKNLQDFKTDTTLLTNLKNIASKYNLTNQREFDAEFGETYVFISGLLQRAFGAYDIDYIHHYKSMNDVCKNIATYLDCFNGKFKAWLVFLNDPHMNELYVYDSIISKVLKLSEINDGMSKIEEFLSNDITRIELMEHNDTIDSLKRFTSILFMQCHGQPNETDHDARCMNNRPGFIEFHKFITDEFNQKYFVHDSSFEELRALISIINDTVFKHVIVDMKLYLEDDHEKELLDYELTILYNHPLSI